MTKYICSECFCEFTFKYADSTKCSMCRSVEREEIEKELQQYNKLEKLKTKQFLIRHEEKVLHTSKRGNVSKGSTRKGINPTSKRR